MQPLVAAQPQQLMGELAVCWEMGPNKLDTGDPQERRLAGKTANGQVQCEDVYLLVFDLCCLSLESVTSRGC